MLLRDNPYFAILCTTAVISGCVAFTAWLRRADAPATRPFTGLMIAIALHASVATISAASASMRGIIFWTMLEAVCASTVTTLYFIFTLYFTHRRHWLTPLRRAMIWLVPVFNSALILTNPWHQLVWQDFSRVGSRVEFQQGPGYLWLAAWFYLYVITGSVIVARTALHSGPLYRKQAITVIISTLPPLVGGTFHVLDLVPAGISLLPMSFLFTGLTYFTSLFRFRLFDLLPIARDTLIESMADSVLVLDNEDRVIDMNPAARQFTHRVGSKIPAVTPGSFPNPGISKSNHMLGQPVTWVLGQWPSLLRHCQKNEATEVLITICQQPPLHINLRLTMLYNQRQKVTGKLLVIRDVTTLYQTQLDLKQVNEIQQQTQLDLKRTNEILESRLRENESLQQQLKEQAIRDGLTGLFNRRYFNETLLAEFAKARRAGSPLGVILIDIDHFKQINDTYGHQAGDRTLQVVSDVICEQIRTSDIACRYGGEEFIIALPGMSLDEAYRRAQTLRMAIGNTVVHFKGEAIQVTISGGVGALPEYEGNPDGLISVIDGALYEAKRNGRDDIQAMPLNNATAYSPLPGVIN